MSVRELSNEQLLAKLKSFKKDEDERLADFLEHLSEVERRRLYIGEGFTSLFGYLTQGLGYSENEAYRRVQSSRLMHSLPEIKEGVQNGDLTLSTMTDVSVALRAKQKSSGKRITRDEKRELVELVTGCSRREAQKLIATSIPEANFKFEETRQARADGSVVITVCLLPEQHRRLEAAKDILAHKGPLRDTAAAIDQLSEFFLKRKDLTRSFDPGIETLRYENSVPIDRISIRLRRAVFHRDRGRCQFQTEKGKICASTYQVELDHIVPLSAGGRSTYANLRCLCRVHNQWKGDRLISQ